MLPSANALHAMRDASTGWGCVLTATTDSVPSASVNALASTPLGALTCADPAVFALTVALATSNSFLIPTHQVNALIMGPGGYRVKDFVRAGGMMTILFLAVMLGMLNLMF